MLQKNYRKKSRGAYTALLLFALLAIAASILYYLTSRRSLPSAQNWPEYNGGPDRSHYSSLAEITADNIAQLEKAWEYSSGGADTVKNQTQMQCNPIVIDGVLYGVSAGSQAFAVDAS